MDAVISSLPLVVACEHLYTAYLVAAFLFYAVKSFQSAVLAT
jgi:hypothetical protein